MWMLSKILVCFKRTEETLTVLVLILNGDILKVTLSVVPFNPQTSSLFYISGWYIRGFQKNTDCLGVVEKTFIAFTAISQAFVSEYNNNLHLYKEISFRICASNSLCFYAPAWKVRCGHLLIGSFVRPSVRLSVCLFVCPSVRNSVPHTKFNN